MFEPYTQNVWPSLALMQVVLRTRSEPAVVINTARQIIGQIDPGIPLANISTLETLTGTAMAGERFSMLLVGFFAALSAFLAAVGIYGVISYSVAQRTREIGIRVALGAQRVHVFNTVVRSGLQLSGLGILIGVIGALATARILTSFLYGVSATDPLTFICVSVSLASIAVGASFFPACHAATVDPLVALRND
jgi:putative ABC transport system permease protein